MDNIKSDIKDASPGVVEEREMTNQSVHSDLNPNPAPDTSMDMPEEAN